MPTLHATPDWMHPSTTTSTAPAPTATTARPEPTTVTAVTPAPTTTSTTEAPVPGADDVVLLRSTPTGDVVLLPPAVVEHTATTVAPVPTLPVTGAPTVDLVAVAVALVAVGVLATITARRANKKAAR